MQVFSPTTTAELTEVIASAAAGGTKLSICGGGSKAAIGRNDPEVPVLDMRGFTGIVDYDPAELVLTVRAGTPLTEVDMLIAAEGQMLAFEPFDHGPIFGQPSGAATIGGVVAAGVAGPRRLSAGGVRDHLLGLSGVSGRGEAVVAGARVVKNVTGFDVPKIIAGSWGRLAALTEVTIKVLPAPPETVTLVARGLDTGTAYAAMAMAMGSQAGVAATAHLPGYRAERGTYTAFRLEGFGPSVAARRAGLERLLDRYGRIETLPGADATALWTGIRSLAPLGLARPLWRISIPARAWPGLIATLNLSGENWLADWAGGLLWATDDGDPRRIRSAASDAGGHAMLVRADPALQAHVPVFHPRPRGLAALEERVRRAFDPKGVFEVGRFGEE